MSKKRRHKPPSRLRYEASHPVISFRSKQVLYDRFKAVLKQRNQSAAEFFEDALDNLPWHHDTFLLGKFVTIPCGVCGKPLDLDIRTVEVQNTLKEVFSNWVHKSCLKTKNEQLLS